MKKLLLSIGLCLAALYASAQNHNSQNLLNVRALQTGTNGYSITNTANLVTNQGLLLVTTNVTYTNNAGVYVGFDSSTSLTNYLAKTGTTNQFTNPSLFKDAQLWADRNGFPIVYETHEILAGAAGATTNLTYLSSQTLFIEYVNPAGTNGGLGVVFRPVFDGVTPVTSVYDWGFGIAAGSTGKGTLATNIPTWKWPGAKALRVVRVTNSLEGAGLAFQTNSPYITKLSVNGFVP